MISVDVRGGDRLRRAAEACRWASRRGVTDELRTGLDRAVGGFAGAVAREVPGAVPSRYAAVLAPAIRVDTRVTGGGGTWPSAALDVRARGRRRDRALPAIERGTLRHPVYGNRRVWAGQQVRGRMVARAARRYEAAIREAGVAALRRVAQRVEDLI